MIKIDKFSALYERMSHEQDIFRTWLLHQEPEEILKHTYEYTTREDILIAFSEMVLEERMVTALLKSPSPMQEIYKNFASKETDYMDSIRESIEETAKNNANKIA